MSKGTDTPPITLDFDLALEILDVLGVTPIYSLLNSREFEEHLPDDFKPEKWEGFELEHAEKAVTAYRKLLAEMTRQTVEKNNNDARE